MVERLISADSHVKMTHSQIKEFLPSKLHDAYDDATKSFERIMSTGAGADRKSVV